MRVNFSDMEKDTINVCKVRHDTRLSCRKCKYKETCANFYETVNQKYYELKEILHVWKKQQFTEQ